MLRNCRGAAGVLILAKSFRCCEVIFWRGDAEGSHGSRSGCVVVLEGGFVGCEVGEGFCS